ncbi:sugar MFS transporter [Pseudarthrobacter sp. NamE5]|uniref:MFS transporter n=1 Tax=Pseudarthrobacter sp. NamE5 TaxID=2576839 RepID=UPI00110A871B|nr:MFS transporter [Pseudarthrobacter sp. NamE5]TLM80785.1 MFS transporter [Pseudarthrobacter sp. NamE5]
MSFKISPTQSSSKTKRRHYALAALLFLTLGAHVGVWAVQLSDLAREFSLSPGQLGGLLAVPAIAGLVTLFGGGYLADRFGRKPVLLIGLTGTAVSFLLLSHVTAVSHLVVGLLLYGLFISFVDLGANSVGADYESEHRVLAMTGLHAWFSFGALAGAVTAGLLLAAGVGFRAVYTALAVALLTTALVVFVATLPVPALPDEQNPAPKENRGQLWGLPGVGIAIVMVTICFFGDGALESFLSIYLRDTLATGPLMAGIGIGSFHLASLLGRLLSASVQHRIGERRTLTFSALLAAAGIALAVATTNATIAIFGILVVGFAIAPIVPTSLSLAARAAPGKSGQAVGLATAVGYGSFILSPVVIGAVATATTLRIGLGTLILTALAMALVAAKWPGRSSTDVPTTTSTEYQLDEPRP